MQSFATMAPALVCALLSGLASSPALAGSGDVTVSDSWARASIGTARPGVAYMTIRNRGATPVTLTGLRSDAARAPMLHRSGAGGGMAVMTPEPRITIPAGGKLVLEPGSYHAMLAGLTHPLVKGDRIEVTLLFDDGGRLAVHVPVLGIAARGPAGGTRTQDGS